MQHTDVFLEISLTDKIKSAPNIKEAMRIAAEAGMQVKQGFSRRNIYRMRKNVYVPSATVAAKPNMMYSSERAFDAAIAKCANIKEAMRIVAEAGLQGKKGFSRSSLYNKLKGNIGRKPRADKGLPRNKCLISHEAQAKLTELVKLFYLAAAKKNISLVCLKVKEYCEQHENYWELAAVPQRTLIRNIKAIVQNLGLTTLHRFQNHRNLHNAALPRRRGSFENIDFMKYIIGDDHKADVAAVWVYENNAWKKKQVQIWLWMEASTRYPLGYYISTSPIRQKDIIFSLVALLKKYGLPEHILIDNGIGRGKDFRAFVDQIYAINAKPSPIVFSAAYTPTNKAPIERAFRCFKEEFDVFLPNHVGPRKDLESRHSTAALSPENDALLFEEYEKYFAEYLNSTYINRIRNIAGTKNTIINLFNAKMLTFSPFFAAEKDFFAALAQKRVCTFDNKINLAGETYIPNEPLPIALNGKKYIILYNPFDDSFVDMYALEDSHHAKKGTHIARLTSMRHVDKDKMHRYQKATNKALMEAAASAKAQIEILSAIHPAVTPDGKIKIIGCNETDIKTIANSLKTTLLGYIVHPENAKQDDTHSMPGMVHHSAVHHSVSLTYKNNDNEGENSLTFEP